MCILSTFTISFVMHSSVILPPPLFIACRIYGQTLTGLGTKINHTWNSGFSLAISSPTATKFLVALSTICTSLETLCSLPDILFELSYAERVVTFKRRVYVCACVQSGCNIKVQGEGQGIIFIKIPNRFFSYYICTSKATGCFMYMLFDHGLMNVGMVHIVHLKVCTCSIRGAKASSTDFVRNSRSPSLRSLPPGSESAATAIELARIPSKQPRKGAELLSF